MNKKRTEKKQAFHKKNIRKYLLTVACILFLLVLFFQFQQNYSERKKVSESKLQSLQNGNNSNPDTVHQNFGAKSDQILAAGEGLEIVKAHCTSCHSAKLIVQNRATREGWLSMIRWMQQTQNLWDLGEHEEIILNYLSTQYPPEETGRRANLKDIEWHEYSDQ